jgi:ribonuclease Z
MVSFRPYRPPVKQEVAPKFDRFHPALQLPASLLLVPETLNKFTETQARIEEVSRSLDSSCSLGNGVTVISLGTGSAVPSKYRNGQLSLTLALIRDFTSRMQFQEPFFRFLTGAIFF